MLCARNNSTIDFSGGAIHDHFFVYDNAILNMSGGYVGKNLAAIGNSTITLSGGSVAGVLNVMIDSRIYLVGSGFEVTDLSGNTSTLSIGDKLSDYGTFVDNGPFDSYFTGNITGVLADGSFLDNTFHLDILGIWQGNGNIIITPEPATILFFGLGGMLFRRKHKVFYC